MNTKLNLGCGQDVRIGYVNIDLVPANNQVIKDNVLNLDKHVAPGSCSEVVCNHLIEYLTPQELPQLIEKLKVAMRTTGIVTFTSFDYTLLSGQINYNNIDLITLNNLLYGNNRRAIYNLHNLKNMLTHYGFKNMVSSYDEPNLTFTITAYL